MPMITVTCPILNEARFLPAWLTCVQKFADQILIVDSGSTDGSIEFLRANSIEPHFWPQDLNYSMWNHGAEGKVRNFLVNRARGEWIVPLDADELVGDDFIELLKNLKDEKFLIGRFTHFFFWESFERLRARSIFPLFFFHGKYNLLRNWRGNFPCKIPRLFRNVPEIRYSTSNSHCLLQYKNYGHWSYHLPGVTRDFDVGFYHFHYIFGKGGANRDWELGQKVKTVPFTGNLPDETRFLK